MLETKSIMLKGPEVVAEHLFVEVTEQMKWFDANVCAFQSTLEQTPEILQPICVDLSINIAFRVVDNIVPIIFLQPHVRHERIGVDRTTCFDMGSDVSLQRVLFAVRHDHCADFAATLQNAEHRSLILGASLSNPSTVFLIVHVPRSAADESLIYLNFAIAAADFENGAVLHCETNAVKHEPCRLLSDAESAANLVGTDSVLAVGNHPNSDKPLVERDCGILKDSSHFAGELFAGVLRFAFPQAASRDKANLFASASGALDAIGPAALNHKVEAVVGVSEVQDGLLERSGLFHGEANVPCAAY